MTSWWQRLAARFRPAAATAADEPITAAEMVEYAEAVLWPGFRNRTAAVEAVTGFLEDSPGAPDAATAAGVVDQVWREREAVLAAASDPGDRRRVDAVFTELEQSGWVARMDFTCCQTCGDAEIEDERRGGEHSYVFFHQQDSERLAGDRPSLALCYSYFDSHPGLDQELRAAARAGDEALHDRARKQQIQVETAVGATLVECLRRHDLEVDWDGSHQTRPIVALRNWHKPLPTEP